MKKMVFNSKRFAGNIVALLISIILGYGLVVGIDAYAAIASEFDTQQKAMSYWDTEMVE